MFAFTRQTPRLLTTPLHGRIHVAAAIVAGTLLAGGCVPQEKYNAQRLRGDALDARLTQAEIQAREARAEADSYKTQFDSMATGSGNMAGLVSNLQQQNQALQQQLQDIERRYNETVNRIGSGPALPAALSSQLTEFARQNADLVEFDEKRGMVKFKSDVTFASGDAEVRENAKQAIRRFSRILNSEQAKNHELLVAGHTDNQPVSNPATKQKGHKDNMHLSSHRAISVAQELKRNKIDERRMGYVGYADTRPVADNSSNAGRQQNRRVEVLILPTTYTPSTPATARANGTNNAARGSATPVSQNKDDGAMPTLTFDRNEPNK